MGASVLERLRLDPRKVIINMRLAPQGRGETPLYEMSDIQAVSTDGQTLMTLAGSRGMYNPGRVLQAASSRILGYQGNNLFTPVSDGRSMFSQLSVRSLSSAILTGVDGDNFRKASENVVAQTATKALRAAETKPSNYIIDLIKSNLGQITTWPFKVGKALVVPGLQGLGNLTAVEVFPDKRIDPLFIFFDSNGDNERQRVNNMLMTASVLAFLGRVIGMSAGGKFLRLARDQANNAAQTTLNNVTAGHFQGLSLQQLLGLLEFTNGRHFTTGFRNLKTAPQFDERAFRETFKF